MEDDLTAQVENLATMVEAMRETIANLMNENLLLRQANVRARAALNGGSEQTE
ncbi:MAG: hypothetical protein KJO36_08325 [Acidimicrobiia bacterium]|nr:hypothetical protein [Acidimicrobiia bacterium]